jgi:hypothetical protein
VDQRQPNVSCVNAAATELPQIRCITPISVSAANCVAVTGMSWSWVLRFARENGVEVWRVGARKQVVSGPQLAAAMARVKNLAPARELTDEELLEESRREILAALRGQKI